MANARVDQRLDLLRGVPLFSNLDARQLESLAQAATIAKVPAQRTLFEKGDPGRHFYGVLRGRVKVTTSSAEGGEVVFDLIAEGETFGELALLAGGRRTAPRRSPGGPLRASGRQGWGVTRRCGTAF